MSQENVEVIRRAAAGFERGDLDGMLRYHDPEIEWVTTGAFVESAAYRGHEGLRRYLGTMLDEFDDLRIEPEQLIDAGEQVVVSMRISGRGKLSGAHVELTLTSVSLLRDGNIVRVRNYSEKAEALEAVGLRK
jgi:ketosteroid isomerase-like protein